MYCYTNKETSIAALVEALRIPVTEMRVCALAMKLVKGARCGRLIRSAITRKS